MKKLCCALFILLFGVSIHAQTPQESAAWLQARLKAYDIDAKGATADIVGTSWLWTWSVIDGVGDDATVTGRNGMKFRDITDVTYRLEQGGVNGRWTTQTRYVLTLIGPCMQVYLGDIQPLDRFTINLRPETPKEDIDRVVKAIKHLAVLNGAKIPDDDLFK